MWKTALFLGGEQREMNESDRYRGRSKAECDRYGKPHINARYTAPENTHRYEKDDDATCAICGRPATDTHHWPPLGKSAHGIWLLRTRKGIFALKPALFALCRTHHELFHLNRIKADWVWDSPEAEEAWWSGELLSKIRPHSPELYAYGRWRFDCGTYIFEYRGGEHGERKALRSPVR